MWQNNPTESIKTEYREYLNAVIDDEIKSKDFSFTVDKIDNILNKIRDALKGKFQIITLKDLNKKMEQSINSANIYINYIFPSTLEYILVFSSKIDGNTVHDTGVIYTINFDLNNLCKEVFKI